MFFSGKGAKQVAKEVIAMRTQVAVLLACVSFWQVSLLAAQTRDHDDNLSACKDGWPSCDHSKLSPAEARQVAVAERQHNVSDCRDGRPSCDASKLTLGEVRGVAAVKHDRNLSDCRSGWQSCDYVLLTAEESREVAVAEHQRNFFGCRAGGTCDHSQLTIAEGKEVALAERQRNLSIVVSVAMRNLGMVPARTIKGGRIGIR